MSWMDNVTIAESSQSCVPCGEPVTLERYRQNADCVDTECEKIDEFQLYATIQPAHRGDLSEIELTKLGERQSGMIAVHYFPVEERHAAQDENGVFVRTSAANFQINDFNAAEDGGCADRIIYQGQVWRAVKTSCATTCCDGEDVWACRAYFCLDNCKTENQAPAEVPGEWVQSV